MDNSMSNAEKRKEGFLGQEMVVIPKNIRNKIDENSLINNLYATDIGYYPHAVHHYRERLSGTKQFILIYCTEGEGWIRINSDLYELQPNSYFIIPAGVGHTYGSNQQDPWSIYWIHFTGKNAVLLYEKFLKNNTSTKKKSGNCTCSI